MTRRLLYMVRWPEAGRVKTRLAARLGAEEACRIHKALAERCFAEALQVPGAEVIVCGTGAKAEDFRGWLGGAADYWDQPDGGLGTRLEQLFGLAFAMRAASVGAIGSDAPDLDAQGIGSAFEALAGQDVSLLPAADGGYVFIGTSRHIPDLFRNKPWGTGELLSATRAECERLGLRVASGRSYRDVDTEADWLHAQQTFSSHHEPTSNEGKTCQ